MHYSLLLLALTIPISSLQGQECRSQKADGIEATHWGRERIVLKGQEVVRRIKGKALDSQENPMSAALVEVFTDPNVLFLRYSSEREKRERNQRRVAACITNQNGEFCFPDIKSGSYELRVSKQYFDGPQMKVIVDLKRGSNKGIDMVLLVSQ